MTAESLFRDHKGRLYELLLELTEGEARPQRLWDEGFFLAEMSGAKVPPLAPDQERWLFGLVRDLALDRESLLVDGHSLFLLSRAVGSSELPALVTALLSYAGATRLAAVAKTAVEAHIGMADNERLFFGARPHPHDIFTLLLERWFDWTSDAFMESGAEPIWQCCVVWSSFASSFSLGNLIAGLVCAHFSPRLNKTTTATTVFDNTRLLTNHRSASCAPVAATGGQRKDMRSGSWTSE